MSPGDVVFPVYDERDWDVVELFRGEVSERNEHAFVVEDHASVAAAVLQRGSVAPSLRHASKGSGTSHKRSHP